MRGSSAPRAAAASTSATRRALPTPEEAEHPLAGTAAFLFEMGHLKNLPRAGWLLLGIPQPESVAEHSFRVGIVGMTLAAMEGADVGHTAALCLLHDAHETRIGDVPSVGRAYVTTAAPEAVTAHQTSAMPHEVAKAFQALTAEYEATETPSRGWPTTPTRSRPCCRRSSTRPRDTTPRPGGIPRWPRCAPTRAGSSPGRSSAAGPQWWSAFAASYHELRGARPAQDRARKG